MDPVLGFGTSLALTVVLLALDVLTGLRRALRWHLPCVAATFVSLAIAIYFAKELGPLYDLEAAGLITPIHLALAKVTTALYLLVLVTGVRTLRDRARRGTHRVAALVVLGLTVASAVTGLAMIVKAPRLSGPLEMSGGAPAAAPAAAPGE